MSATFVLRCSSAPFFRFVIGSRPCILGRSNRCDFVVDHPSISRQHAQCRVGESGLIVTDLGSRNGTLIDYRRIQEDRAGRGQLVRFGNVEFVVTVGDALDQPAPCEDETDSGANGGASAEARPELEALSLAQRRVFDLLRGGKKETSIARALDLSPHTVHNHVRAIFRRFGVHSRAELLARLLQRADC